MAGTAFASIESLRKWHLFAVPAIHSPAIFLLLGKMAGIIDLSYNCRTVGI